MTKENIRIDAKKALRTVFNNNQNITILEKNTYKNSYINGKFNTEIYLHNIYQIIGDIINKKSLKQTLKNIKNKNTEWKHPYFYDMDINIQEQNDFIQNPFEVEEGVFQCKAIDPKTGKICGSKRVYSYTKQDRSCDEGTSVYAQCVQCNAKWRERG